ncbi:MAG: DUF1489 family protein [Maricaulaceae bacterium]
MSLHLIKLCVGAETLDDLVDWQNRLMGEKRALGDFPVPDHVTRMAPQRRDAVLDGGSMYWVIKRVIQVRQRILDLETFKDSDGVQRCRIVLDPTLHPTQPRPKRPFQGWRYLKPEDAPRDLTDPAAGGSELPAPLRRELLELGAW